MLSRDETGATIGAFLKEVKRVNPGLDPKYFMIDNCTAEVNGIHEAFPGVGILLCIFHAIQVNLV